MPSRSVSRTELILAIAIVLGGAGFFLISRNSRLAGRAKEPAANSEAGGMYSVQSLKVRRDRDHFHLIIETRVRNQSASQLLLTPSVARLLAGEIRPVGRFIAPFLSDPLIAAGAEQTIKLHYWLPVKELDASLELEIGGQRTLLKDTAAFAPDQISHGQTVAMNFPAWRVAP